MSDRTRVSSIHPLEQSLRDELHRVFVEVHKLNEQTDELEAENERLREALLPFAEAADECDGERAKHRAGPVPDHACTMFMYRTLAAAREALRVIPDIGGTS